MPLGKRAPILSAWHRVVTPCPTPRTFAIVREPCSWYESFWHDQTPLRLNGRRRYLHQYWSEDLDVFVLRVLKGEGAYVTELFASYTYDTDTRVFRLEDGVEQALQWATRKKLAVPRKNCSKRKAMLAPAVRREVKRVERGARLRYGYE